MNNPNPNSNLPTPNGNLKVAIVHDWLIGGGAEKVVEQLHKIYPDAPIYTSYCTPEWRKKLDYKVVTGPLQAWPFSKLRKFIPFLRIWWFSTLKFKNFDLVISSTGAEAKGIKTKGKTQHISYIHAPTHYYWSRYDEYLQTPGFGGFDPLARLGLKLLVGPLRRWDQAAAQRPDFIVANSTHTQNAIHEYYGRKSTVIHPPVDTKRFAGKPTAERQGFVVVGRQVPYKRIDLAVEACTRLNLPLTVLGNGPQHSRLKAMAGPGIEFVPSPTNEEVAQAVQNAAGFIFPGIDDFGIAPVEALSAGTPVLAYQAGGALDYVVPGKTGEFFKDQTVNSLTELLKDFNPSSYNHQEISKCAENFSEAKFKQAITKFVHEHTQ